MKNFSKVFVAAVLFVGVANAVEADAAAGVTVTAATTAAEATATAVTAAAEGTATVVSAAAEAAKGAVKPAAEVAKADFFARCTAACRTGAGHVWSAVKAPCSWENYTGKNVALVAAGVVTGVALIAAYKALVAKPAKK